MLNFTRCTYITYIYIGYIIHATNITDICESRNNWWYNGYYDYEDCGYMGEDDITPEPEYLIGRGFFVGFHAIYIGLTYVANNKLNKCGLHSRIGLIRLWSFLFMIYSLFVLCWIMTPWYYLLYMAFSPALILITLFLNCFLIKKSNEAGGCTSGVSLGLIIVIAYYFSLLWLVIFIIVKSFKHDDYDEQGWYLFWDLSILLFGGLMLWILERAMSPVNSNCGCSMDGCGDGNIISPQRQQQLQSISQAGIPLQPKIQQPQPIMMVVPQTQTNEQQQPLVITTAALPNDNEAAPPAEDQIIKIPIDPQGYQQANDDDVSDGEGNNL